MALTDVQSAARQEVLDRIASGDYERVRVSCPLCSRDAPIPVAQRDMYGLPLDVGVCGACGLVYSFVRLSDEALRVFYDAEYRRLDRGVPVPALEFFELERRKGEMIDAALRRCGGHLSPGSLVVEVGCGAGGTLAHFRARGHGVLGVDLGSEYVAYGVQEHGLPLHVGDVRRAGELIAEAGAKPALVIYEQVLEHVPDPVGELRRARELAGADTLLFVGVPGLRDIRDHYQADFLRYLQLPHLTHFDLASLEAVAGAAGWQLLGGDEAVRALLRPSARPPADAMPHRAEATLEHLRRLERQRRRRTISRGARQRLRVAAWVLGNSPAAVRRRLRGGR